jgi:hypothetical protein
MRVVTVNPLTGRKAPKDMVFAHKESTNPESRTIVSVDSESVNLDLTAGVTSANPYVASRGWHSDIMLVAADDKGTVGQHLIHDGSRREASDDYPRNYGLPTSDVIEFLLNLDIPANALVTSFVFSYDVTKLLGGDLPLQCMKELSNEGKIDKDEWLERVTEAADILGTSVEDAAGYEMTQVSKIVDAATTIYDGRYWLHYIPRKQLEIIDLEAGKRPVQDMRDGKPIGRVSKPRWWRKITVWDSFGFFQKPFVGALKDYRCGICDNCKAALAHCGTKCPNCSRDNYCLNAPWTLADIDRITAMKAHRGAFTTEETEQILGYCYDECRYLSFLYRDLITSIYRHDPELYKNTNRHDGSGAIASAYIKTYKITQHYPKRVPSYLETYKQTVPEAHHCHRCEDTFKYLHCALCGNDYEDIADLADHLDSHEPFTPAMYVGDNHTLDGIVPGLPEDVALYAYGGGRFEVSEIGYMGSLYGYDINSAYPHIIRYLPCLAHGYWERVSEYVPGKWGVYLCGSRTKGVWAPFQFRTNEVAANGLAKQAMYYAHGGKRWVWADAGSPEGETLSEVGIARKHFGADTIPIYDGYVWVSECEANGCSGLAFGTQISELYELRKVFVKQGNGVEKVLKLILNSLYGKTAQSIGWAKKRVGDTEIASPPASQCFAWAGMITSGCRAMILDGIMHPDADVVSIATDGILTRTPIPLDAPKEKILGKWDYGEWEDGYLFQSGVYTYLKWDKWSQNYKRTYKTRGFSPKEIQAEQLIAAYFMDETRVRANPDESRFVQMRAGVNRTDALEYIGQWIPSEHDITIEHTRRFALALDEDDMPIDGIIRYSEPAVMCCQGHTCEPCRAGSHYLCDNPPMSAPYKPKQSWEEILDEQDTTDSGDFYDATPVDLPPEPSPINPDDYEWTTVHGN